MTEERGNDSLGDDLPLVSIIIPCKNSAEFLPDCLESVRAQTYPNVEIIVVDNYSEDETVEIAGRYSGKVYQMGPERNYQFNYGLTKASGSFIYRIDSDFVLEPDVVEKCVAKAREGYDALALFNRIRGDTLLSKIRFYEKESYHNDETVVAVRFVKKEVFDEVGTYDTSLPAFEDYDFHNRIVKAGYKWCHVDAVEYHIGEPKNVREQWGKWYYYGKSYGEYRKKHREEARRQRVVVLRPSYKRVRSELIKSPRLLFSFYAYLMMKFFFGFLGYAKATLDKYLKPSGE